MKKILQKTLDCKSDSAVTEFLRRASVRGTARRDRLQAQLANFAKTHRQIGQSFETSDLFASLADTLHCFDRGIRRQLIALLRAKQRSPKELIRYLCNDSIDISVPLVLANALLKETDLLEIVELRSLEHRLSWARRARVPHPRADTGLLRDPELSIAALLNGRDAKLKNQTLEYLAEEGARYSFGHRPIVSPSELGPQLSPKIAALTSAALHAAIVERFELDADLLDDAIRDAEVQFNRTLKENTPAYSSADMLVRSLDRRNKLNVENLPFLLNTGETGLFIAALQHFAGLPALLSKRLLFEEGGEALAICCKSIELSKGGFVALYRELAQVRVDGIMGPVDDSTPAALRTFNDIPLDKARRVLAYWQTDREFLAARRALRQNNQNTETE